MTATSVDLDNREIETRVQAIPLGMDVSATRSGLSLRRRRRAGSRPPWKAILSNKGILPAAVGRCFPNHPNLLPAYFEDDPDAAKLGTSFVRKAAVFRAKAPMSRLVRRRHHAGLSRKDLTARKALFRQALAPLPIFFRPIFRTRKLAGRSHALAACRSAEDENPITGKHVPVCYRNAILLENWIQRACRSNRPKRRGGRNTGCARGRRRTVWADRGPRRSG